MSMDVVFLVIILVFVWVIVAPIKYFRFLKEKKRLAKIFYDEYYRDEDWYKKKRDEIEEISRTKKFSENKVGFCPFLKKITGEWLEARNSAQKKTEKLIKKWHLPFFTIIFFENDLFFIKDGIDSVEFYDERIAIDIEILQRGGSRLN